MKLLDRPATLGSALLIAAGFWSVVLLALWALLG